LPGDTWQHKILTYSLETHNIVRYYYHFYTG